MALLDLPLDLLVLITPHLDTTSFLALTSTCKALHTPSIREDALFWSARVRRDFRVPNQPVVASDGERWMKLYKRLRTQSRVFTWGNNERGCLGHSNQLAPPRPSPRTMVGRRHLLNRPGRKQHVGWPEEMEGIGELGVIADLQCGGWSTTLLTAKGVLYTVGVLDGLQYRNRSQLAPRALEFPAGLAQPKDRYDSRTATRQFSAGRGHVLALSDSGKIWSWSNIEKAAVNVKFVDHTINENGQERGRSVVRKVVAGWNKSAALIEGTGIVVWEPLDSDDREDATLVLDSVVMLRTNHVDTHRTKGKASAQTQPIDPTEAVGEVSSFIVLEDTIVFCTTRGKAFASLITWSEDRKTISEPVELPIPVDSFVTDVQGSFQNFAVFFKSGAVLTSKQDALMPHLIGNGARKLWTRIPALQNQGVIALAFGDYHFHALHAPGHITSYGYEPQGCGALGLGEGIVAARLRGIRGGGMSGDGHLVPHAYTEGRRVWFERPKRNWLAFLAAGGVDLKEAEGRVHMATSSLENGGCQGEVSEWIEQESRNWSSKYGVDGGEDGLGAYFALGVTAAGWHSGALVLVNEDLVDKLAKAVEIGAGADSSTEPTSPTSDGKASTTSPIPGTSWKVSPQALLDHAADYGRYFLGVESQGEPSSTSSSLPTAPSTEMRHVWDGDSFPRLRLSNGTEMPGAEHRGFDEWAFGRPEWQSDWEGGEDL